jgi:hypothetical protein
MESNPAFLISPSFREGKLMDQREENGYVETEEAEHLYACRVASSGEEASGEARNQPVGADETSAMGGADEDSATASGSHILAIGETPLTSEVVADLDAVDRAIRDCREEIRCIHSDMEMSREQVRRLIREKCRDLFELREKLSGLRKRHEMAEYLSEELRVLAAKTRSRLEFLTACRTRVKALLKVYEQLGKTTRKKRAQLFSTVGIAEAHVSLPYLRDLGMLYRGYLAEAAAVTELAKNGGEKFFRREAQLLRAIGCQSRQLERFLTRVTDGPAQLDRAFEELDRLLFLRKNAKPIRRMDAIRGEIEKIEAEMRALAESD